ncbi:MAG: TonB-dependent receptor [Bacteroides sp.]|nr:TonB-dependent receptor [Roseburia sp.]MCM1347658.1 TonB-dependent receptor [Bacteroides sp.]MCM1422061.1 TonB-dependent receptor [Bacteroides sp.]
MRKRVCLFFVSLMLTLSAALAQRTVTGVVINSDTGEPVIGASVLVKGTTIGNATDIDGHFTIAGVPDNAQTMKVSYIGMKDTEVAIKSQMKIYLSPATKYIDDVMVVAYGTQKKSSFTGSAAEIKAEAIEDHVVSNVTSALAGQMAGVQMTSSNGDPGDNSPSIRIRGIGSMSASNSPLYVVDGMPFSGSISSINPQDIESLNVLKDAAASAIYGARGANGVVLITTKKGRAQDAEVKFDARWGSNSRLVPQYDVITDPGQYIENHYKALYNSQYYAGKSSAESYAYADANLYNKNNGGLGYQIYTVPAGEKLIGSNFKLNPNATLGYSDGQYYYTPDDWYDETFHSSFRQEYNVSLSGVGDRINYYASVGYLKDGGIVNNSEMQRYTGRVNVDYKAKKWLTVNTSLNYTHTDTETPSYDNTVQMSSGNIFYICNTIAPIYPLYVRNADGSIMTDNGRTIYDANQTNFSRPNVVGNAVRDNEYNSTQSFRDAFSGKWSAKLTPVKGLTLMANIGADVNNVRTNALYSPFGSSSTTDGGVYVLSTRSMGITNQYLGQYQTEFDNVHHLDITAGYEQYKYKYQYFYGYNDHLYSPFIGELGNAVGNDSKTLNSYTENYMVEGYLARVQYDYDEKYFISGSFRRDASSRFAPGHRWGNFGSVGAAWQLNKERFLEDVSWIDLLKFKISYGVQGNDSFLSSGYADYYPYADRYETSYNSDTGEYSIVLVQKGNDELTWETSHSFNTGFDFTLFNHRLYGSIEYFSRKTTDLLYNKPTPLSSGIVTGSYPVNVGAIVNKGVELTLNGVLVRTNDIQWDLNLNLTHYSNKITELDPSVAENGIKGSYYIYEVGGSLYNAYAYKYAGVDSEGKALYYYDTEVQDPDDPTKTIVKTDKTSDFAKATQYDLGSTLPKVYGGFGTTLKIHDFDLSAQFSYQLGGKIYDGMYQTFMHNGGSAGVGQNWHKDILNAWTPENTNTDVPRLNPSDNIGGQAAIDRFYTSSDYLCLNNLTVGYTFPKRWLVPAGISGLRIYVAGENLALLTARKGLDPRFSMGTGSMIYGSGSSSNYYSAMRTITAGLTLTF